MKTTSLALTRRYLENKSARKGLSRRTKIKWDAHYASVLNRIDQAFAEKPDAAADRAFAVYDASLTVAFAAHAAALATTDADDLAIALARREAGNRDFHSDAVAVAETALSLADAAYDAAARSAADAYDAAYDLSSVQP